MFAISVRLCEWSGAERAKSREPAQCPQPRDEAVLAAAHGDEPRQTVQPAPNRPLRNSEDAVAFVVADQGILLGAVTDEIPVGGPLRLNELELSLQMRADQQKDAAALGAVILEDALWQ